MCAGDESVTLYQFHTMITFPPPAKICQESLCSWTKKGNLCVLKISFCTDVLKKEDEKIRAHVYFNFSMEF